MKKRNIVSFAIATAMLFSLCGCAAGGDMSMPTTTIVQESTTQGNVSSTTSTNGKTTKNEATVNKISTTSTTTTTHATITYTTMTKPTYVTTTQSDYEYNYRMTELKHKYSMAKEEIKMECDRDVSDNIILVNDLKTNMAQLQSECLLKTQPMYNQLSELEKTYREYKALSSTNSYYATMAQQYESKVNAARSNISNVENSYLKRIREIENAIKSTPTKEEREQIRDNELAELEEWYNSEVDKLNEQYGK